MVIVAVDTKTIIALNRLGLGAEVDGQGWRNFKNSSSRRAILAEINPKMVRIMQWKMPESTGPAVSWNSATHTGTFNWSELDQVVNGIIEIGAEPLVCVGNGYTGFSRRPPGMALDPATGAPYPDDWKEFMRAWVVHYKGRVRYWDTFNEPYHYYLWNPPTSDPLYRAFRDLHIAAYEAAHEEDPNCFVSFDAVMIRRAFEDFKNGNYDIDFLDFHHYGGSSLSQTDRVILDTEARKAYFGYGSLVSIDEARQAFINRYGFDPEIVHGETNWNYVWDPTTDMRNNYIQCAVFSAMQIGWGMELGLTHRIHFVFADDSKSAQPGPAFGMISDDTEARLYSWHLYRMIGPELGEGDPVLLTSSNDPHILAFAWRHGTNINIMLINRANSPRSVKIEGVFGQVNYKKISSDIPWDAAETIIGTLDLAQTIQMPDYCVMLLQGQITNFTLHVSSNPIDVPYTINGVSYPSGSEIDVQAGDELIISVPKRIVEV